MVYRLHRACTFSCLGLGSCDNISALLLLLSPQVGDNAKAGWGKVASATSDAKSKVKGAFHDAEDRIEHTDEKTMKGLYRQVRDFCRGEWNL